MFLYASWQIKNNLRAITGPLHLAIQ